MENFRGETPKEINNSPAIGEQQQQRNREAHVFAHQAASFHITHSRLFARPQQAIAQHI
jgi:hypothetical protein